MYRIKRVITAFDQAMGVDVRDRVGLRNWVVLLGAAALMGCSKVPEKRLPNVVFISIDTLRADHCGFNGYERDTTPVMDQIAAQGTVFSNAYAASSWTVPSMASLFTGLYPRQHGVLHGFVEQGSGVVTGQEILAEPFMTLPELFRNAGYKTFGVFSNGHVSRELGYAQGFDSFTSLWYTPSPAVYRVITNISAQVRSADRYFVWVHLFDPHEPLHARKPWIWNYTTDTNSANEWKGLVWKQMVKMYDERNGDPSCARALLDLYDSEINFADHYVGMILQELGVGDDALIVITSDHGDEFWEHGYLGHSQNLYEQTTRVPLVIRLPVGERTVPFVERPVSNKDIYTTLVEILGLADLDAVPGTSFFPLLNGENCNNGPVYMELDRYPKSTWRGMRQGHRKVLCHRDDPNKWELYDIEEDPPEQKDLSQAEPGQLTELRDRLITWIDRNPEFKAPVSKEELSPEQIEKLRSLGYIR